MIINCRRIISNLTGILLLLSSVDAYLSVLITQGSNATQYFPAIKAGFGPDLSTFGHGGFVVDLQIDSCKQTVIAAKLEELIDNGPFLAEDKEELVALIPRGNCTFDQKVYFAQLAGISAVVIFDDADKGMVYGMDGGDDNLVFPKDLGDYAGLIHMTSAYYGDRIEIPSVFVSYNHGLKLQQLVRSNAIVGHTLPAFLFALNSNGTTAYANPGDGHFLAGQDWFLTDLIMVLIVIVSLTCVCAILSIMTLLYNRYRVRLDLAMKEKKNRITPDELELIPVIAVQRKHGLDDGTGIWKPQPCAICLDELELGSEVRGLLCGHLFHLGCVDDWFLKRHRTCPTCRREVIIDGKLNSDVTKRASVCVLNMQGLAVDTDADWVLPGQAVVSHDVASEPALFMLASRCSHHCHLYEP